jgi:hypothetical protein
MHSDNRAVASGTARSARFVGSATGLKIVFYNLGGFNPGLLAHMQDRRVAAFYVRYPAGGD